MGYCVAGLSVTGSLIGCCAKGYSKHKASKAVVEVLPNDRDEDPPLQDQDTKL